MYSCTGFSRQQSSSGYTYIIVCIYTISRRCHCSLKFQHLVEKAHINNSSRQLFSISQIYKEYLVLVVTMFNEGAYLSVKSIFHKFLRLTCFAQGNNGILGWDYVLSKSNMLLKVILYSYLILMKMNERITDS